MGERVTSASAGAAQFVTGGAIAAAGAALVQLHQARAVSCEDSSSRRASRGVSTNLALESRPSYRGFPLPPVPCAAAMDLLHRPDCPAMPAASLHSSPALAPATPPSPHSHRQVWTTVPCFCTTLDVRVSSLLSLLCPLPAHCHFTSSIWAPVSGCGYGPRVKLLQLGVSGRAELGTLVDLCLQAKRACLSPMNDQSLSAIPNRDRVCSTALFSLCFFFGGRTRRWREG